jgi:uncharacterized membrane protein
MVCPACGAAFAPSRPVLGKTGGLRDNIAGSLAYVTALPALFFLLREPFRSNRFIRFHSVQSIGLCVVLAALACVLFAILGSMLVLLAVMVLSVGCVILWLLLLIKALQGEMFKLPLLGDFAERQAGQVR